MLTTIQHRKSSRGVGGQRRLWHDRDRHALSIGCGICLDRDLCGGLQVQSPPFNCLGLCRSCAPETCDAVCRNKPAAFAQRVREVDGFDLETVPRAEVLKAPTLPGLVPLVFHGKTRVGGFRGPGVVCLPLFHAIPRADGQHRYPNRDSLAAAFGVASDVPIILSGTADDRPLERWWSLGSGRLAAIRGLVDLGVGLVTTPNYSLFTDQPRWDDLHSMKRIAIVHEEFLREGLPAALHLNARTERDWERWTAHVAGRPEVTHVAVEFATGARWYQRAAWHSERLVRLARDVGRPLHLLVRGGAWVLPMLVGEFPDLTVIETSTFVKTVMRHQALRNQSGVLAWTPHRTARGETLDALLEENWTSVAASYASMLSHPAELRETAT